MRLPVQDLMNMYKNNVYAAAFSICKNASDAEDVVQDTFLQYYMTHINFDNEQHIRAWLLRVAINKAKNIQSSFWHRNEEGNIKLSSEGESELEINWKTLYGRLTPGTYRITMTMADWDFDNPSAYIPAYPLMAQFIIAGTDGM